MARSCKHVASSRITAPALLRSAPKRKLQSKTNFTHICNYSRFKTCAMTLYAGRLPISGSGVKVSIVTKKIEEGCHSDITALRHIGAAASELNQAGTGAISLSGRRIKTDVCPKAQLFGQQLHVYHTFSGMLPCMTDPNTAESTCRGRIKLRPSRACNASETMCDFQC